MLNAECYNAHMPTTCLQQSNVQCAYIQPAYNLHASTHLTNMHGTCLQPAFDHAKTYTRPRNIIDHDPKQTTQQVNDQRLCHMRAPRLRPHCVLCASHARPMFGFVSNAEKNNDGALFPGTETLQLSPPLGPPLKATQEVPLPTWCIDLILAPGSPGPL